MHTPRKAVLLWSGGKDSALALHHSRENRPDLHLVKLVTCVSQAYDRVSMHGVQRPLIEAQANALGLPVEFLVVPSHDSPSCPMAHSTPGTDFPPNDVYSRTILAALAQLKAEGIEVVVFGDLFLEDLRAYRDGLLAFAGLEGCYPLWGRDTEELYREFNALGFQAITVCVDTERLTAAHCGQLLTPAFRDSLPSGIDPCGERGEYHSFTFDGPPFRQPVLFQVGEIHCHAPFAFQELHPVESPLAREVGEQPIATKEPRMKHLTGITLAALASLTLLIGLDRGLFGETKPKVYESGIVWKEPKKVTPGTLGSPPSDAVVLFDGKNMDAWKGGEKWVIEKGAATASSLVSTKQSFGDCQLHVEFATPKEVSGTGQGRGNNGIGLMGGRYEIQVLDSWDNPTYLDGMCAAIYKQRPPLVNASRKPGEWQMYDILFEAPRFTDNKLVRAAFVTVFHNGVLVHNHAELIGDTPYDRAPSYTPHAAKLPLVLMYHGNPVRFRNIWIREVKELEGKHPPRKEK